MEPAEAKTYGFETAKPLVDIAKVPVISFLTGDAGKAIFDEYQGRASKDFGDAKALQVLDYDKGVVRGSNPFAVALVGQVVRKAGWHVATPADIEKSLACGDVLGIKGNHYVDTGLVLQSTGDPNGYLAQNLAEQLKVRGKVEFPVMVPLAGVDLVKDSDSNYGFSFKVRDDAQVIHAPVLNKDGTFSSADIDTSIGLPRETREEGDRRLYTRTSGLSRLSIFNNLNLYAYGGSLGDSNAHGRVAVVRSAASGGDADFEARLRQEFEAEQQKQQQKLEQKYQEALAVFRKK